MKNQVHLITYANRLGGSTLNSLSKILTGPLEGLFAGVHILPFFFPVNGADAGFDPIDHTAVDLEVGTWQDIQRLGSQLNITADLIVNHISTQSPQFEDFQARGEISPYKDMFLTYHNVFPQDATDDELAKIYRPRPGLPFTEFSVEGKPHFLWTTFTPQQVDINVNSDAGWDYLQSIITIFAHHGVRTVRLDAVGYACKKKRHILLYDPGDVPIHPKAFQ